MGEPVLDARTEASSDPPSTSVAGEFKHLLGVLRRDADGFMPEGQPIDGTHREAFVLLLAYGCAIEKILSAAAGRGGMLPGHRVSLRSYVEQLLGGEAEAVTVGRLEKYFEDAVSLFARTRLDSESALQDYAEQLAKQFQPDRIERRVRPNGLMRLFGLHEGAYWREYKSEFHSLDATGVKQLASKEEM